MEFCKISRLQFHQFIYPNSDVGSFSSVENVEYRLTQIKTAYIDLYKENQITDMHEHGIASIDSERATARSSSQ